MGFVPDKPTSRFVPDKPPADAEITFNGKSGPDYAEELSYRMGRAKNPEMGQNLDFLRGASSTAGGAYNLIAPHLGLPELDRRPIPGTDKAAQLAGNLVDPVALAIGGAVGKVLPYKAMFGGGVKEGSKALLNNAVSGGVAGGAIGGLSDDGTVGSGVGWGMGLMAGLPLAVGTIGLAGRKAGEALVNPVTKSGQVQFARKWLADRLGPAKAAVIDALMNSRSIVSGSPVTAADAIAAANVGQPNKVGSVIVGAQNMLERQSALADLAKTQHATGEAARAGQIDAIAGPPGALNTAIEQRGIEAGQKYGEAFSGPPVKSDSVLNDILSRPSMRKVVPRARNLASEKKKPFSIGEDAPEVVKPNELFTDWQAPSSTVTPATNKEYPVESLHFLKMAMDDLVKNPAEFGIGANEAKAIRDTQRELISWMESQQNAPAYGAARTAYAEASKPINRMEVGEQLASSLRAPTGAAERPTVFSTAVNNAPATIKRATGEARYSDLADILTQQEMGNIGRVKDELTRNAERALLGKNVDMGGVMHVSETGKLEIPHILSRTATAMNWLMGKLGKASDQQIAEDMGRAMLTDPKAFAEKYLVDLPPSLRQVVMAEFRARLGPNITGAAAINASQGSK